MLMAADRVNVVEGLVDDVGRGRIPNIPAEMGVRAELAHNRAGFAKRSSSRVRWSGSGILLARQTGSRHRGARNVQR